MKRGTHVMIGWGLSALLASVASAAQCKSAGEEQLTKETLLRLSLAKARETYGELDLARELLRKYRAIEESAARGCEALAYFEARGAVRWIGELLTHPARRRAAVVSLCRIGEPEPVPLIADALEASIQETLEEQMHGEHTVARWAFQWAAVECLGSFLDRDMGDVDELFGTRGGRILQATRRSLTTFARFGRRSRPARTRSEERATGSQADLRECLG